MSLASQDEGHPRWPGDGCKQWEYLVYNAARWILVLMLNNLFHLRSCWLSFSHRCSQLPNSFVISSQCILLSLFLALMQIYIFLHLQIFFSLIIILTIEQKLTCRSKFHYFYFKPYIELKFSLCCTQDISQFHPYFSSVFNCCSLHQL